jgi:hypothetical protein
MNQQKLTITDRFIYNLINSYTINDKPFFASNDYLAKELGKSKSVISHSISRLLKTGYLENRGNKMARQLYTKGGLLSADFNTESADFNTESAENSISFEYMKEEIAKNSNNKMLKTAIESAENSNILLSILISYTNIKVTKVTKDSFLDDEVLSEYKTIWLTWLQYKKETKSKYKTANGEQKAFSELLNLSSRDVTTAKNIVQQSIDKEWRGFFVLKGQPQPRENKSVETGSIPYHKMTLRQQVEYNRKNKTTKTVNAEVVGD